jgi:DNA-binding NtrC family response regulator
VGLAAEVASTEQATIEKMLIAHGFNRAATARALGISRVTLYNKLRKYRIRVESLQQRDA